MNPEIIGVFIFGGIMLVIMLDHALQLWRRRYDIPSPKQAERYRQKRAREIERDSQRRQRLQALEDWNELKPRVATAIASHCEDLRRVELSEQAVPHLDYFNAELAKRGWVLVQSDPYRKNWYHVQPISDLPLPAVAQIDAANLPVALGEPQR